MGETPWKKKNMEAANSPMKRKENDLKQTSRELCSMLIFRGVLLCLYRSRSDFLFGFAGLVLEDTRKEAGGINTTRKDLFANFLCASSSYVYVIQYNNNITYPVPMVFLKMIFLFPRWDM